jgi:hypothetical protein
LYVLDSYPSQTAVTVQNTLLSSNTGGNCADDGLLMIDGGNNLTFPTTDQRGNARTDGDNNGSVVCDIGAYEAAAIVAAPVGNVGAVPSLSEWGIAMLGLMLAGLGASRYRKARNNK